MCMNSLETKEEREKWLKDKPKTIVAYKVVRKVDGKYYPSYYRQSIKFYPKRLNKINESRAGVFTEGTKDYYIPYYHLFYNIADARKWQDNDDGDIILKCEIPKKYVTDIGMQHDYSKEKYSRVDLATIVTKAFRIMEEVR